jgi:8-oxo-dGTP pyrophosphatase MutT (NUDIX family)
VTQPLSVRIAETIGTSLRFLPVPVLRAVYRAGYFVMRGVWSVTRPDAYGSKIVVRRGEEVLLVRLTYGRRKDWDIPGGTLTGDETPAQAAERELREETGLGGRLRHVGTWRGIGRGDGGRLDGFLVDVGADAEPQVDPAEIAEARWFALDRLPRPMAESSEAILRKACAHE